MESFNFLDVSVSVIFNFGSKGVFLPVGIKKIIVLLCLAIRLPFLHGDGNQVALAGNGRGIIIDSVVSVLSEVDPVYGVGSHACGGEGQGECCGSQ